MHMFDISAPTANEVRGTCSGLLTPSPPKTTSNEVRCTRLVPALFMCRSRGQCLFGILQIFSVGGVAIPCIQTKVVWRCGDRLRRCGTLSGRAICSARCGAPSIYSFAAQCARIIAVPCATLWCRCPWVHESCWIYTHIHMYVYVYIHISCVLMCIRIYPHIHSQAHVSRSAS